MSNWAVIYVLSSFFSNFPICKMRDCIVSRGYCVAFSLVLKTKTEISAVSCLIWLVIQEVFKNLSPVTTSIIPTDSKETSYVKIPHIESPQPALIDQETVWSRKIVLVTVSQWKSMISTREQQKYTGTCDVHSERGESFWRHISPI